MTPDLPISPNEEVHQEPEMAEDERAMEPEGSDDVEENGEERKVSIPRSPETPTKAQVEEHRQRAHLPYRSWCDECVQGRKKNPPHKRVTDSDHCVPCVHLDYCFLRDHDASKALTVLVSRDEKTKVTFCDACPSKGAHEYAVEQAAFNIKRLGYKKMAIKSDQEPALAALIDGVALIREHETIIEKSPVAESA